MLQKNVLNSAVLSENQIINQAIGETDDVYQVVKKIPNRVDVDNIAKRRARARTILGSWKRYLKGYTPLRGRLGEAETLRYHNEEES